MSAEQLDATFFALADPTRRAILARLATGEKSVKDLAQPFAISAPAITKHLKVLERAGLVATVRDAQRRPRSIVAAPLQDVDRWLEQYRRFWESRFASLDAHLRAVQAKPQPSARAKAQRRKPTR